MATDTAKRDQDSVKRSTEQQGENRNLLFVMDILRGIFGALGLFGDEDPLDSVQNSDDPITLEDIVFSSAFLSEVPDFHDRYPSARSQVRSATTGERVTDNYITPREPEKIPDIFANETTAEAAVRATLSLSIERYTEQSIARNVKYELGAKGEGKTVDCSGFVANVVNRMTSINPDFTNCNLKSKFANHSDGQVAALSRMTEFMIKGDNVNMSTLKAGMVIGIDSGRTRFDGGADRQYGIDHVGVVYMDSETRELMFSESRGGKGVMTTPLKDWLKLAEKEGYKLYASDLAKLASEDYKMQMEEKIKLASAAKNEAVQETAAPVAADKLSSEAAKEPSFTGEAEVTVGAIVPAVKSLPIKPV